MKEYDCRICGESFTGLDKRNSHEELKHTKTLDEFGISTPKFEKNKGEKKTSRQRTLRFF